MPRERGETIFQDATAPAVVAAVPALRTAAAGGRFTAPATVRAPAWLTSREEFIPNGRG
jgi:hypothetical protein